MEYYFSGVPSSGKLMDYIITHNLNLLYSQLNQRRDIYRFIERIKLIPDYHGKLFIDSGSFSAWTKGKSIDIDDYISFINKNIKYISIAASVDVIPGKAKESTISAQDEIKKSAELSWKNFLYMRSKILDVSKLLYTFHIGEPFEYLEKALQYEDKKGKISYIALGGLVGKPPSLRDSFISECFKKINSLSPKIKVHAFGVTALNLISKYPLFSVDSTTWAQTSIYGQIYIKNQVIAISDKSKKRYNHFDYLTQFEKEFILQEIQLEGFTLEQLIKNSEDRKLFNIIQIFKNFKDITDRSNFYKNTNKQQLW